MKLENLNFQVCTHLFVHALMLFAVRLQLDRAGESHGTRLLDHWSARIIWVLHAQRVHAGERQTRRCLLGCRHIKIREKLEAK